MRIFWKKYKNRLSVGSPVCHRRLGILPPDPRFLLPPAITTVSNSFLALNMVYYPKKGQNTYSKCSAFASTALLHLFFIKNFVVFVEGSARIFLAPGRKVP